MTVDDFVDLHRDRFPVRLLCAAVGHRRSTYYARRSQPLRARGKRDAALAIDIASVRRGHNRSRGRRNVAEALRRKGKPAGVRRIGRVMQANGWYGAPRSCKPRPAISVPVSYRDLVQRQFHAPAPNQLWWGDVTEIPTRRGTLYLASLQDAHSRYIVGFALSAHNDTDLAASALRAAVRSRRPSRGLIHHTDRGSPYLSWEYQAELQRNGALTSVSRKGNPHDNACIESFHSTLERELLAFNDFRSHAQAVAEVSSWIRHFNRRRFHSTLGRLSPAEFERHHA